MYRVLYTTFISLFCVFHLVQAEQDDFEYEFYPACLNSADGLSLGAKRSNDLQPLGTAAAHVGKSPIKVQPGEKYTFAAFQSPYLISGNSSCRLEFVLNVPDKSKFDEIAKEKSHMEYHFFDWVNDRCETTIGVFVNNKSMGWFDCKNAIGKDVGFATEDLDDILAMQYNITVGADPVTSVEVQTARVTIVGMYGAEEDGADRARMFYYISMAVSLALGLTFCTIKCCVFTYRASAARNARNARNAAMGGSVPPVNAQAGDTGQTMPPPGVPGNTPLTGTYRFQPTGYGMSNQPVVDPDPPPPYSSINPDRDGQDTQWTRV